MPQVFKIGSYWVFFWANRIIRLSPFMFMFQKENQRQTKSGKCLLANNNSDYDSKTLNYLSKAIEANSDIIIEKWLSFFGEFSYYC